MKFDYKIPIDLEDFFLKGEFDQLKIGMTKQEVAEIFPDPDDWADAKYFMASDIWRYGNFELLFFEDKLSMIFNDYIATMDGGKSLEVKKWIFEEEIDRTLMGIMRIFNQKHIDFEKRTNPEIEQVVIKVIDSEVYLTFNPEYELEEEASGELDVNDFELGAICKLDETLDN